MVKEWKVEYKKLPNETVHAICVKAEKEDEARTIANNLVCIANYRDLEVEDVKIVSCIEIQPTV